MRLREAIRNKRSELLKNNFIECLCYAKEIVLSNSFKDEYTIVWTLESAEGVYKLVQQLKKMTLTAVQILQPNRQDIVNHMFLPNIDTTGVVNFYYVFRKFRV